MRAWILLLGLTGCPTDPKPHSEEHSDETPVTWEVAATDSAAALMGVGGSSAQDIWAVGADDGSGGLVLHSDGKTWTRVPVADHYDLWWTQAFADGTVFVAGAGGTILKGNASGFSRMETPGLARDTVYGLWGSSSRDVWAVGGYAGRWGFLWHFDGSTWSTVDLPDSLPLTDAGELPGLFKVWGRSASDVWVVGTHGTILHYDGTAWSVIPSGTTELLFTVHGNAEQVAIVGANTVLLGGLDGFSEEAPEGIGIVQGVFCAEDGQVTVSGQSGIWTRSPAGSWEQWVNTTGMAPESLHAVWQDPEGGRWAVGGAVLTPALNEGLLVTDHPPSSTWTLPDTTTTTPVATCPADAIDPVPEGSIARRWNEQLINSIRRDIPRPGVHARNLFHSSVAMWDAWAIYDTTADPYLSTERLTVDPAEQESDRQIAISYAVYRVLNHRYASQIGGAVDVACYDALMARLGLDPSDTHTDGNDPIAVGNRVGQQVISTYAEDGANEANNYADTTGWTSINAPLVVDEVGTPATDPEVWQPINLAAAETQNGIVLESGVQSYIGAQWGHVVPFAMEKAETDALYHDPGPTPSTSDPQMKAWVLDVLEKSAHLDHTNGETIDISPGAFGNNSLGQNDGVGYPVNPVTGQPYAPNVVALGDFGRVMAEFWADGPKSETPPGHWNVMANFASDSRDASELRLFGEGEPVDRLSWDVHLYFALNGALHDAAITAWGVKRETTASRPITLIRWMAMHGQCSEPGLPSYDPDGLPLEDGVVEIITAESAAPGERHEGLRRFIGEIAVKSWRGEPGDRTSDVGGVGWIRAKEWIPYQRRTFVTPAFPGFISGHSTFSRAGAEVLTLLTGSPYFPGGLGEFVATAHDYLVFEDGPEATVTLQWATYQDAADQAGQSRIWGGIHIWPDDTIGRQLGYQVGHDAVDEAQAWFAGTGR